MPRIKPVPDHELDELVARAETKFAQAAHLAFNAAAAKIRESITASGSEAVSADDAAVASTVWTQQIQHILPLVDEAYKAAAYGVFGSVGDAVLPPAANAFFGIPPILDQAATDHLVTARNRITRFGDSAWNEVRSSLVTGFQQGEGIDKLASRVQQAGIETEARARTIARTEIISASNAGAMASSQALPSVLRPQTKEWLATLDNRTRESHAEADGQKVPLDDPFIVGGYEIAYPGDGPAEESVNCRCTVLFDVADVNATCAGDESLAAAAAVTGPVSVFKQVRLSLGLSRKQMADKLGWSQFKLDKIELGKMDATSADIDKFFTVPGYQEKYAALNMMAPAQLAPLPPNQPIVAPGETVIGSCVVTPEGEGTFGDFITTPHTPTITNELGKQEHILPQSRISHEVYSALDPRTSSLNSYALRDLVRESPDDETLYKVMKGFQSSTNQTKEYRRQIGKLVRGEDLAAHSRNEVEVFLDAMQNSPEPPRKLYRGMKFYEKELNEFNASYHEGSTIDMDVASFSSSHDTASGFAGFNSSADPWNKEWTGGGQRRVIMELDDAQHALPFEKLSDTFAQEREWVTNGRFRIYKIEDTTDAIRVYIRQEQVLTPSGELANVGTRAIVAKGQTVAREVSNIVTSQGVRFDSLLSGMNTQEVVEKLYAGQTVGGQPAAYKAALETYRVQGGTLNRGLRGVTDLTIDMREKIAKIDKAFETSPKIESDIVVHRTVDNTLAAKLRGLVGNQFFDDGYTTTTIKTTTHVPSGFTGVDIVVPKGARMLPTDFYTSEAVLPRSSWFKVLGDHNGRITLEYMG